MYGDIGYTFLSEMGWTGYGNLIELSVHPKEGKMKIESLNEDNIADAYCCLDERRELFKNDIDECVVHMKKKLREGWLAYAVYDDAGEPVGMSILLPSSDHLSPVVGENLYYFHCMDINKSWRKRGIGKELTDKITEEVKAKGGKGLAVNCYGEYWMPCDYFTKRGFETLKVFPEHSLMLKSISEGARAEFTEVPYKGDVPESGIQVDIQHSVTCPFMLNNYRKVGEMAKRLEPDAIIRERVIDTKEDIERWGGSGVYVNGKSVSAGPVDEAGLKKAIEEAKGSPPGHSE